MGPTESLEKVEQQHESVSGHFCAALRRWPSEQSPPALSQLPLIVEKYITKVFSGECFKTFALLRGLLWTRPCQQIGHKHLCASYSLCFWLNLLLLVFALLGYLVQDLPGNLFSHDFVHKATDSLFAPLQFLHTPRNRTKKVSNVPSETLLKIVFCQY